MSSSSAPSGSAHSNIARWSPYGAGQRPVALHPRQLRRAVAQLAQRRVDERARRRDRDHPRARPLQHRGPERVVQVAPAVGVQLVDRSPYPGSARAAAGRRRRSPSANPRRCGSRGGSSRPSARSPGAARTRARCRTGSPPGRAMRRPPRSGRPACGAGTTAPPRRAECSCRSPRGISTSVSRRGEKISSAISRWNGSNVWPSIRKNRSKRSVSLVATQQPRQLAVRVSRALVGPQRALERDLGGHLATPGRLS